MNEKTRPVTLMLRAFESACQTYSGLQGVTDSAKPTAAFATQMIEASLLTQLHIQRNMLMEAEMTLEEVCETERVLIAIETKHSGNKKIVDSVRQVRAALLWPSQA